MIVPMRNPNTVAKQMLVFIPTLILSAWLGHEHVPLGRRLMASLGFGLFLIVGMAFVGRRRR
jgi:hypothetical protein